jgi:hypothetical protein
VARIDLFEFRLQLTALIHHIITALGKSTARGQIVETGNDAFDFHQILCRTVQPGHRTQKTVGAGVVVVSEDVVH